MFLIACNFPPTFGPEYKDPSINFIANRELQAPPPATDTGTSVALDSPAQWDFAWRGRTNNTYEYMKLTSNMESGPASSSVVWKLEMVNLAQNATCSATTGWEAQGADASLATAPALHGTALKIKASGESSYIRAVVNTLLADIDTNPKSYVFSCMVSNGTSFKFFNGNSFTIQELQSPNWTADGYKTLPFLAVNISSNPGSNITAIYTGGADVFIDDIHAIRADINVTKWSLRLILRQEDTNPILVPGIYEFTLYVKKPSGYTFPGEDGRGDSPQYAVQYLTLRMVDLVNNSILAQETFDISVFSSSAWTSISLRFPRGKALQFTEGSQEPVLSIEILPLSTATPFAGALLIADPALHYYINGY